MHVLIVGAGPGGLTVAQCLRKQGISFEIFDRDADENARFQGWAIGIHTIIEELLSYFPSDMPDLKESVNHLAPLTIPAQVSVYFSGVTGRLGFEDSPEKTFIRAERLRLRKWCSTGIPIQYGKHAKHFEHNDEEVSIHFDDGTIAKGDILVGADGINSHVREHLLQRPNSELLNVVPTVATVGQVTLSGEEFRRQLELGHSGHNLMNPELGFVSFNGLHEVLPDGHSGRFFWIFMEPDPNFGKPEHWSQTASQQEKLNHVLTKVSQLPPRFREIFELTSSNGIRQEVHFFRDLELKSLPAGRVVLVGDAAHAMSPFRGEGGYQTFIDGLNLSKGLIRLDSEDKAQDIEAVKRKIDIYNAEMLERGTTAVRASRGTHAELIGKMWIIKILLAWLPLLLTIILGFAIDGPIKLKPLPEKEVLLPGEKPRRDPGILRRLLYAILRFLGIARLLSVKEKDS